MFPDPGLLLRHQCILILSKSDLSCDLCFLHRRVGLVDHQGPFPAVHTDDCNSRCAENQAYSASSRNGEGGHSKEHHLLYFTSPK